MNKFLETRSESNLKIWIAICISLAITSSLHLYDAMKPSISGALHLYLKWNAVMFPATQLDPFKADKLNLKKKK